MKILSAAQLSQWDKYTIQHEPVTSIELMERAAGKCTQWIIEHITTNTIKIFCGKGNNGGDGLAIARQLHANGITCEVYIVETGSPGTADFNSNLTRLNALSIQVNFLQQQEAFPVINSNEVVIDCLFGSGLNRPVEGLAASLVQHINNANAKVVSIDLPSGMFADESSLQNRIIKATHTLTFQTLKLCFLLPENEDYFGDVHVLDIGLHPAFINHIHASYELIEGDVLKSLYKSRRKFSHKGTYGHSLVIAGENGKMGAAVLCTKGCLRSGSGLVSCAVPQHEFNIIQTAAPEAMALAREDIKLLDWNKYSSIAIGPGIGTNNNAGEVVNEVMSNYTRPIVIDADALNIISENQGLLNNIPRHSILTPHPKEFERMFGKTANNFEQLKLAKQHAEHLQVYIIVKGSYSMLACADGEIYFNSTGNPGMATGGSGDVLTGILAGLLSQGYSAKHACMLGMYLHGLAGDLAAQALSQEALIAGDIIEYLGKAFLSVASK